MITLQVSASKATHWPTRFGAVTIPRPSERCQADSDVQKAVATLGATISTVMGALSCFTAGYWGEVSEQLFITAKRLIFRSFRIDMEGH